MEASSAASAPQAEIAEESSADRGDTVGVRPPIVLSLLDEAVLHEPIEVRIPPPRSGGEIDLLEVALNLEAVRAPL